MCYYYYYYYYCSVMMALFLAARGGRVTAFAVASKSVVSQLPVYRRQTARFSSVTSTTSTSITTSTSTTSTTQPKLVTHPSFEVLDQTLVQEYGAACTLYRHKKSGAQLLSVSNDDDNKVFGITFRTPPSDSTGVPHIEHSVLCGSRKYKTKDPFVQLLQGSLQTF